MTYPRPFLLAGLIAAVPLVSASAASPALARQAPDEAKPLVIREGLALPGVVRGGRVPFSEDRVLAAMARGTFKAPVAGEAMDGNEARRWQTVSANAEGALGGPALRGGACLYARVVSPAERTALLEARGASLVYVNGEPRPGDVYGYNGFRVPVRLRAGANEFLFSGFRGALTARLLPMTGPVSISTDDATLPDLLAGKSPAGATYGAVVVYNGTGRTVKGLRLTARVGGASVETRPGPSVTLPPFSVRKLAFRVPTPSVAEGEKPSLTLRLAGDGLPETTATLPLRVRKPTETYKVTFLSDIDGSVQYYAVNPAQKPDPKNALVLSLHGASVEASGQADAYGPKDDVTLACPTNRRPFGFDWEDWGRVDAMEVLADAQRRFRHDPARVGLTGHSMGGHGTWALASLFPDRFNAAGPSAGWISFATYGGFRAGAAPESADAVTALLLRGQNVYNTLLRTPNLRNVPVYVLHGDADDNVPVTQARDMRAELAKVGDVQVQWHEEKGAGHWWDNTPNVPGADCVDWPPLFALLKERRIPSRPTRVDFVTPDPSVSADSFWVRVEQQARPLLPSAVRLTWDAATGTVRGTTENVRRLTLLPDRIGGGVRRVELDGVTVGASGGKAPSFLRDAAGRWSSASGGAPASEKRPERAGPFKQTFLSRFVLVYGTRGTAEENAWSLARARYDAENFLYRGNGSPDVLSDAEFLALAKSREMRDRSVVVYGNADNNAAWAELLPASGPVSVRRGALKVGDQSRTGDSLLAAFVRPRPGSDTASVAAIGGTGMPALRATERMNHFVSGAAFPDWVVADASVLTDSAKGVHGAGYFGADWSYAPAESAWRDASRP